MSSYISQSIRIPALIALLHGIPRYIGVRCYTGVHCSSPHRRPRRWQDGRYLGAGISTLRPLPREHVTATVAHESRATALSKQFGVPVTTDNLAAAQQADILLLGVKPQQVQDVVSEIAPALGPGKLLISFAASVKTSAIEEAAGCNLSVIRAMPNTPAMVGAGITAICRGNFVTDQQLALAEQIFATVGRTVIVDEKHMDAVTGLSGSGPAFLYIIIEALAEAGVNVGLPRDIATLLAAQTTYGAAKMVLETGSHPALLKDEVTTRPAAPSRAFWSSKKEASA